MRTGLTGMIVAEVDSDTTTVTTVSTTVVDQSVRGASKMLLYVSNQGAGAGGVDLNAFTIAGYITRTAATPITMASAAGDYTSPSGWLLTGDGTDLTTLIPAGTGWVRIDVEGLDRIEVAATVASGNTDLTCSYTVVL